VIGLFALVGWSPEALAVYGPRMAERMASKPEWVTSLIVSEAAACGRIGPRTDTCFWSSVDGMHLASLDGYAFRPDQPEIQVSAGELASSLLERGPSALLSFHGEFSLVIIDHRHQKLYVATDRFGTRPAYWYVGQNRLVITSELHSAFELDLIPRKLNNLFVIGLLKLNKCRLGDSTLFDGVSVVPPGTVQIYDLDHIRQPQCIKYYEYTRGHNDKETSRWISEITYHLRRATENAAQRYPGGTALALSGGLDSRLVLASLSSSLRRDIFAISCGLPNSDEVRLASETAICAGSNYTNVDLNAQDYIGWARKSVIRNEEFDIFVQGAQIALHQTAAQSAKALMTGWDLDIPLRGTYLDASVLNIKSEHDLRLILGQKWGLFSSDELANVLKPSFGQANVPLFEDWLTDLLSALPAQTALDRYLLFVFQYEKRRLLMLRNRMIRWELETVTPFYDAALQKILSEVPETLKFNNQLFVQVLSYLGPELMSVPYQRTMLPPSVPVEFWKKAFELEELKEDLYRAIYAKTGVQISYKRYYSNFGEWLATAPSWLSLINELLMSPRTMLTQEIMERDAILRFVEEHKSGQKSHRAKLVYLLTIELYLREYFS